MENAALLPELFGTMVFGDEAMRRTLSPEIYATLRKTTENGEPLGGDVADAVAAAMRDWAMERGATHFTHWFQPMTGITAEKHDSFLEPAGEGKILMEFSGKTLIKGEPDASSFPNGGLRATFEARGYTAWDPTSPAFVKEGTLYIPTVFCSFGGAVLDKKTPLLRSMDCVARATSRLLRVLRQEAAVTTSVGAEQEYFLIPHELFRRRRDLRLCGRTLFGARPPKGQELDDHYFGAIRPEVKAYMDDLDAELWRLGVMAKTEHNEAAPAQHELAPVYASTNIGCDHNQLTMEMMKKVASRHGLVCLLHEKPFAGVNGSGKHNNWSIGSRDGVNFLRPGKTPEEMMRFLLFLVAVLVAVDEYADLFRISVASASNDCRLGGYEAPPVILSVFLGDELTGALDAIAEGHIDYTKKKKSMMDIGASVLPKIPRDTSDRNRTSPLAFTGNKFEFRMLGSSANVAGPNIILNTAVAEILDRFAEELEGATDLNTAIGELIGRAYREHRRIVFNGNGYSEEWRQEAMARGLSERRTTPEAVSHYLDEKNVALFAKHGIFTAEELTSRTEILYENYVKTVHIEAMTMGDMVRREIAPAVVSYTGTLAEVAAKKAAIGIPAEHEKEKCALLSAHLAKASRLGAELEQLAAKSAAISALPEAARAFAEQVLPCMAELRATVDAMEEQMPDTAWPYPSYTDMLFY
ncbi:MAG: glutamine synthetase III [Clostridia bacterium]|nr:glutamine synthetase III [Clostridia bacterium]